MAVFAHVTILQRIIFFQKLAPEVFYKKSIFKNFTKFTGKHLLVVPDIFHPFPKTLLFINLNLNFSNSFFAAVLSLVFSMI